MYGLPPHRRYGSEGSLWRAEHGWSLHLYILFCTAILLASCCSRPGALGRRGRILLSPRLEPWGVVTVSRAFPSRVWQSSGVPPCRVIASASLLCFRSARLSRECPCVTATVWASDLYCPLMTVNEVVSICTCQARTPYY